MDERVWLVRPRWNKLIWNQLKSEGEEQIDRYVGKQFASLADWFLASNQL